MEMKNNNNHDTKIGGSSAYFGVDANQLIALIAGIGEDRFIAPDAIRVIITEDVTLARQGLITLPTAEVGRVPVLIHCLGVFPAKNQL